jgi:glucokinase
MADPLPLLLGVEIGGTKLQLGLGHGDGRLLALERRTIDPARGSEGIRAQIAEASAAILARAEVRDAPVAAAGIGFGGPVQTDRGLVLQSHQVPGWETFPLAAWFSETTGIAPVVLHNDADTAGLGEARFGAGVGFSPLLYVTIGSGIGGGLIVNGQIYRGGGAGAIEIGHLWIVDRSSTDLDVLRLEDIASGWAIARTARDFAARPARDGQEGWKVLELAGGDPSKITAATVAEAARQGDQEAHFILNKAVSAMANALNQAVTLLAPRRIILGGGVSLIGEDLWFAPIRQQLDIHVFPPFRGSFDVVPAALGEEVVVHGAIALARDALGLDRPTNNRA